MESIQFFAETESQTNSRKSSLAIKCSQCVRLKVSKRFSWKYFILF